jgi:hypothetical protein
LDDPFDVGGTQMMFPGDSSGGRENVINCRCPPPTIEFFDTEEELLAWIDGGS